MLHILIVDDEKEIRDGLNGWPWENLGVHAVGCCSHGFEALQFLAVHPVDIILTDIRMPFMDGLSLMKTVSEQYPYISVVVLSGYSDFEYARKAIQFGASDYLLKPLDFSELNRCIRKLTARLASQGYEVHRLAEQKLKMQRLGQTVREIFLDDLFRGVVPGADLEQCAAEAEVMLGKGAYSAAFLRVDRFEALRPSLLPQEIDLEAFTLDFILNSGWDVPGRAYHLINRADMSARLMMQGSPWREPFESLLHTLLQCRGLFKSTFSVVTGPAAAGPWLLHRSLQAAEEQMRRQEPNSLNLLPLPAILLDTAMPEKAADCPPAAADVHSDSDTSVLARAKQYIRQHYAESLNLRGVAEQVYISPGYLSALFKRNGETFLRYLTDVRMKHAMELMADRQYYVYEVWRRSAIQTLIISPSFSKSRPVCRRTNTGAV